MQDLIKNEDSTKFNFEIKSLEQAMEYSKLIASSDLAPKDYRGKPGNVLIAMQFGSEIGLLPLQAIQNIAVINGRPAIWGDAMLALVQNHPICESIYEEVKNNNTGYCIVKRRGEEAHISTFSIDDAKKAGLWGKPGPWTNYPMRMLQMRARGFALRDKFSDVLKGLAIREEVEDYQVISVSERKNIAEVKLKELISDKSTPLLVESKVEPKNEMSGRIDTMLSRFSGIEVSEEDLKNRLGHPVEEITEEEMTELQAIYKAIKKEGFSNKQDFFETPNEKEAIRDDKKQG